MKHLTLLFLILGNILFAQKPIFVAAKVKSVTVYFNAAELTQTVSVVLPRGNSEIVVKNVANAINENTIRIGAPTAVTILSSQFSVDYISEFDTDANNPILKKVKDSINITEKEIIKIENAKNADAKTLELLDKNQQVWGNNSGLNVLELTKMVTYYKQTHNDLSNSYDIYTEKITKLNSKLEDLKAKLETNTQDTEKTSDGKLIIQVINEVAATVEISINYITNNATWKPFYDLRANSVTEPINMVYKAQVAQTTGIDWKKVKLSLSSGNPNQNNNAPELNSWFLLYQEMIRVGYGRQKSKEFITEINDEKISNKLQGKVAGVSISEASGAPVSDNSIKLRGVAGAGKILTPLYVINGEIVSQQIMQNLNPESIKSSEVLKGVQATSIYGSRAANGVILVTTKNMDDYTEISENQLNVSFDIDIPYDVLSNGKTHSVALKDIKLLANFKFFAAPKIEKEAFLMAEITDYSKFNLLPGEANIIFEGMYVGKTYLNANQTADTLSLSMGRDKKIAVQREKITDKSGTKFLSSKKEQTFTFDIIVRNNKKETANLVLKDQYPLSSNTEVEIELLESSNAKVNTETGILIWNLDLKPNETKKLRLSYKVRYPKDRVIGNF